MKNLINLTPHAINIVGYGEIKPSGMIARVASESKIVDNINGINVYQTIFGDVVGLPQPSQNTYYIVSKLVQSASKRNDLLSPSQLVRDEQGNVIGCQGLDA